MSATIQLEEKLQKLGTRNIIGIDEVGRGPWAGPVVTGAVIYDTSLQSLELKDSKQLSAKKRQYIFQQLLKKATFSIGLASQGIIDRYGINQAIKFAILQSLHKLNISNPYLLIDGNNDFALPHRCETIIKGDDKIKSIQAASIVAKVTRDHLMQSLDLIYPNYGFASHVGYGTAKHALALQKHGVTSLHRKSYAPIKKLI